VLARRLHTVYGNKIAVVNAGIGGNQVVGPAEYSPQKPYPGGPSAKDRLDRDVLSLSGIAAVVWLEGINDFSKNGNAPVEAVEAGMKDVVGRIRAKFVGIRIIGATLTSALGSTNPNHGSPEQNAKRKALNEFIRNGGLFDGIADLIPQRSIRRPVACAPNSFPKARPADPAIRSIRTASAIWRWARRLT
jgi:hypothetical protein